MKVHQQHQSSLLSWYSSMFEALWLACTAGGGQQHIGYYGDRKTAAKMYDEVVIATKGTEHFTNFARSTYDVSALS